MKTKRLQASESVFLGICLALAGGYMDAYSYLTRDYVFSNAQTGNIVLLGLHISKGEMRQGLTYLLPISFFVLGVILASAIQHCSPQKPKLHWRQTALKMEAISLLVVGFMPATHNRLASSLVSLACGIQVQAFQKTMGQTTTTVMCIGNIRSASVSFFHFMRTRNREDAHRVLLFLAIITSFCLGAMLGDLCVSIAGLKAIWYCILFFALSYIYMFRDPPGEDNN